VGHSPADVVSTFRSVPLDEIGLHLEGAGLAARLLAKFEDQLED
jgi:hypothetical protein